MIREPWFWRDESLAAKAIAAALSPLGFCYDRASKLRRRMSAPRRAPAAIVCIGNVTVGGVGKTPFAIMLAQMLQQAGYKVHFLSRGHGGSLTDPTQVDPRKHTPADVGDEPLLLASHAPTWISRNKRAGATAASASADIVIMDDGFQNPTVEKDVSILLSAPGHMRHDLKIFPAGPLRERFKDAQKRADAVVEICREHQHAPSRAEFHHVAWLEPANVQTDGPVFAFCGIGDPARFFDMLAAMGLKLAGQAAFPDHHPYSTKEIGALKRRAEKLGATLITTEKDWVRIDNDQREGVKFLPVRMRVSEEQKFLSSIISVMNERREAPA